MNGKEIHKFSRADNNTIVGRRAICGLPDFYTDEDNESKIWKNVTCKSCLNVRDSKHRSKK